MKVVIFAGGYGTRLSEETEIRPKPMVEIGGKPLLWHIMKIYSHYGFNDFIILLGYKGYYIKEYFANYFLHQSDITIDMKNGGIEVLNNSSEPWRVTLLDTGLDTMTGGRLKRVQKMLENETFMLTYGDGVADININKLLSFHKSHGKAVTITSVLPEARFGALDVSQQNEVIRFQEKPKSESGWINAGFFVCEPEIFNYIKDDDSAILEQEPLQNLAKDGKLYTYKHQGFWKPMDTLRDKILLQKIWESQQKGWKVWQ